MLRHCKGSVLTLTLKAKVRTDSHIAQLSTNPNATTKLLFHKSSQHNNVNTSLTSLHLPKRRFSTTNEETEEATATAKTSSSTRRRILLRKYYSPSIYDLVQSIPIGVMKLFQDIQTYYNIEDASKTKQNSWTATTTSNHSNTSSSSSLLYPHDTNKPGRIPRKQQEHQRRLLRAIKKVILPITLSSVPIVGNLFIVGIAFAPRYFLSTHFIGKQHIIRSFAAEEYIERVIHYETNALGFWDTLQIHDYKTQALLGSLVQIRTFDEGGPVLGNVLPLYHLIRRTKTELVSLNHLNDDNKDDKPITVLETIKGGRRTPTFPTMWKMPRDQLVTLAHSTGLSSPILWLCPRYVIVNRLQDMIKDVVRDDLALIDEMYHHEGCIQLTEDELLDACVIRGLPTGLGMDCEELRECLTNHLLMMEQIFRAVGSRNVVREEMDDISLFLLYLPSLRRLHANRVAS